MATSLIDFNALRPNAAMEAYQQGQQNQLAQMQLAQQQQAIRDAEAEREAYKVAGNDYAKLEREFFNRGLGKQALAVGAARAKQRADNIALLKDTTALMENTAKQIMNSPEAAEALVTRFGQQTGHDVTAELAQFQAARGNPEKVKEIAAGYALKASELLPKFQEFSTPGGGKQLGTVNQLTGKFTVNQTMAPELTPYEKARIGQENQRLAQESTSVVYQQDANGNVVALPSKLKAGEVPKARVAVAPGAGMTPLEGKPSEAVAKERGSINQQKSIISGALTELKNNPDAFGMGRGMLGSVVGESAAGKMYETPEETQARAFIFNTVSNVIHERAGTAQSAGEYDTLMRFLPGPNDDAKQIENKLKGYEKWLTSKEAGTGHRKSEATKPPAGKGDGVDLSNPLLK